jgi:hypothetical protein
MSILQKININEIISFLLYPEFSGWLLVLKYTFLFFGFFFLGYTIWALFKTSWLQKAILIDLKEFLTYKPFYSKTFSPKWKKIKKRLESGIESDLKLAVIEADNLLNEVMEKIGYREPTLTEKLEKITPEIIANLNELKEVRKIRDDIVEDPNYRLTIEDAKAILKVYEKTMEDLQAI